MEGRPRRRSSIDRRDQWAGYLFIAPQVLGFLLFVLYPLVMVVWYSLHKWNVLAGNFNYVGGANYRHVANDPAMSSVWGATAGFAVGVVVLNLALALALAMLLNQKLRGTTAFRTIFFSPVVVSVVAWAIVWGFLLQRDGGINGMLHTVGAHGPNWLRQPDTALGSVVVVQVLKNVGLNMVLFLAALQGVPREMYEAAHLDGSRPWRTFRSITLPLISPTVLLTMILTIVGSLQVFATIQVMTGGGPGNSTDVLVYYLYRQAFEYHDLGYASMLGVVLFVLVLGLTLLQWRLRKRWVFHEA
jgi:multiple sugar transport system permease protein